MFEQNIKEWRNDPEFILEQTKLDIGEQICKIMKDKSISRKDLAYKMCRQEKHLSKMINGDTTIPIYELIKIGTILGFKLNINLEVINENKI